MKIFNSDLLNRQTVSESRLTLRQRSSLTWNDAENEEFNATRSQCIAMCVVLRNMISVIMPRQMGRLTDGYRHFKKNEPFRLPVKSCRSKSMETRFDKE